MLIDPPRDATVLCGRRSVLRRRRVDRQAGPLPSIPPVRFLHHDRVNAVRWSTPFAPDREFPLLPIASTPCSLIRIKPPAVPLAGFYRRDFPGSDPVAGVISSGRPPARSGRPFPPIASALPPKLLRSIHRAPQPPLAPSDPAAGQGNSRIDHQRVRVCCLRIHQVWSS